MVRRGQDDARERADARGDRLCGYRAAAGAEDGPGVAASDPRAALSAPNADPHDGFAPMRVNASATDPPPAGSPGRPWQCRAGCGRAWQRAAASGRCAARAVRATLDQALRVRRQRSAARLCCHCAVRSASGRRFTANKEWIRWRGFGICCCPECDRLRIRRGGARANGAGSTGRLRGVRRPTLRPLRARARVDRTGADARNGRTTSVSRTASQ